MAISKCPRLEYPAWPAEDRQLFEKETSEVDLFAEEHPLSRLSAPRRKMVKADYAAFLGFLTKKYPQRLSLPPGARVDRALVAEYVQEFVNEKYMDVTRANFIDHLRLALTALCQDRDWSWLREIANRLRAGPRRKQHPHMTSELLLALGLRLMDRAGAEADSVGAVGIGHAKTFRDGLIIAMLAEIPLRRGTLVKLSIGKQLVKSGGLWVLDIPAEETKTRVPLEYSVSAALSARIDSYLLKFRCRFPGAETNAALWLSQQGQGRPLSGGQMLESVVQRTSAEFGFSVSPHRFRHAAATFWGERDPANVRGAKDLLGHASFRMTEKHYNMARSRIAGRTLAEAIASARLSCRPQLRRRAQPPARAGA
jgi:integrase/recombinase XerD